MLLLSATAATSCSDDGGADLNQEQGIVADSTSHDGAEPGQGAADNGQSEENMTQKITVTAGGRTFTATLADSETARAFAERLPLTLDMSELNGNEKYYYLDGSLPTESGRPGTIHAGDIMLYGSDCLVLFYGTFSTPYSYTRIGAVDNPQGLAEALGGGAVTVTFSSAAE